MKAFFYFDNSKAEWEYPPASGHPLHGKWISPVIFWIEKESITEADQAINQALNIKVEKMPNIACQIFDTKSLQAGKNMVG